ncbi:hypothetical protein TrRE_jg4356, partial [Triparma retinervis]
MASRVGLTPTCWVDIKSLISLPQTDSITTLISSVDPWWSTVHADHFKVKKKPRVSESSAGRLSVGKGLAKASAFRVLVPPEVASSAAREDLKRAQESLSQAARRAKDGADKQEGAGATKKARIKDEKAPGDKRGNDCAKKGAKARGKKEEHRQGQGGGTGQPSIKV